MLHLGAYIMMPFMAGSVMGAPTAEPNSGSLIDSMFASAPQKAEASSNSALIASLEQAASAVDRLNLLTDDRQHVYDFNNPPESAITRGDGGHTVRGDRKEFPALIGQGVSMTVGFIGPCGFNTPHVRSSSLYLIMTDLSRHILAPQK